MNKVIRGIPASPGITIGKSFILLKTVFIPSEKKGTIEQELATFYKALSDTKRELTNIIKNIEKKNKEGKKLIDMQLLILQDPFFIEGVEENIRKGESASKSIFLFLNNLKENFSNIKDTYLKDRFLDIQDVGNRILGKMQGEKKILHFQEPHILFAHDLTPSDTAQLDKERCLGFVTELGGKTSHTAIMARALGIPAVVGARGILDLTNNGVEAIIDGFRGVVILEPDEDTKRSYDKRISEYQEIDKKLVDITALPATTIDGKTLDLSANIELPLEIDSAKNNGARGIGLFRTEFIYFSSDNIPDEETQFKIYDEVAEKMAPDPLIIRTLDSGGDKILRWSYLEEENPFLGWRGIRFCLDREDIFITQLRAILRASTRNNVKIMIPMVSSIQEVRRAKEILAKTKESLKKEGKNFDENLEFGVMVEVPSTALMADKIAEIVDFFSIGTNDLTQYTLAVDRTNERISHLFDHLHPSVIKLMKMTIDGGHSRGIWVGVCGEIASDILATPILVGLGVDEISITPNMVPPIKNIIRGISEKEARSITEKVLQLPTVKKIREYLRGELLVRFPYLEALLLEVENDKSN